MVDMFDTKTYFKITPYVLSLYVCLCLYVSLYVMRVYDINLPVCIKVSLLFLSQVPSEFMYLSLCLL